MVEAGELGTLLSNQRNGVMEVMTNVLLVAFGAGEIGDRQIWQRRSLAIKSAPFVGRPRTNRGRESDRGLIFCFTVNS